MILILQLKSDELSQDERFKAVTGFNSQEHAKFCAHLLIKRTELYVPVAKVLADDLEYAFRVTNTVDQQWFLPEVCAAAKVHYMGPPRGCRSTSVGDILMRGARAHVVSSFGFTELTDFEPALEVAVKVLREHGFRVDGDTVQ